MEVTENDFSKEFLERFEDKEKQYILDFCNTFLKTFPGILEKEILLNKINQLKSFKGWDGNKDAKGHYLNDDETGLTTYEDMNIIYRTGLEERDERNTIYHELIHLISYKGEQGDVNLFNERTHECGLWMQGYQFTDKSWFEELNDFDEMMNEFYAVKMLETEGRYFDGEIVLKNPTKSDMRKISTRYKGNGYRKNIYLAEIYDEAFGNELLKAKFNSREEFVERFNNDFKDLDFKMERETQDAEEITPFSKIGMQIDNNIMEAMKTAIDIWKQKSSERIKNNGFDLYNYLKSSMKVKSSLPKIVANNPLMRGVINSETLPILEKRIEKADEEIIMQQLRPDLVGEQTETEKIIQKKQFRGVISTLRDNIEGLTKEDVEKVSYGEMSLYNHSNLSCLIVSAGEKNFMTFASEDEYGGSSEFSNLPKDQIREIFDDDREVEYATVPTPRHKWSIIRDNNGYIPLTDNPNMEYVELTDEVYLDGSSVEKTSDSKDGKGMGLQQEYRIIVDNNDNKTEPIKSSSFAESLKIDSTQNKKGKMNSASFKSSLATKRKEHRTGHQDVNKSRNIIALRRERDRLSRGENLSEEQINRLNEINAILLGEEQSQKKYNGIGR